MSGEEILCLFMMAISAAGWLYAVVLAIKLRFARDENVSACVIIDQQAEQIAILRLQLDSLRNRPFRP